MGDTRTKVARRIDRVSCCAAQRKTDGPDQAAHKVWSKSGSWASLRDGLGKNRAGYEYKDKSADDFADEVRCDAANRRAGTKHGQLRGAVRRFFPVGQVMKPDEGGADKSAQQLRGYERDKLEIVSGGDSKTESNSWIEKSVLTAARDRSEHPCHYGEGPTGGNHHPSRVLRF